MTNKPSAHTSIEAYIDKWDSEDDGLNTVEVHHFITLVIPAYLAALEKVKAMEEERDKYNLWRNVDALNFEKERLELQSQNQALRDQVAVANDALTWVANTIAIDDKHSLQDAFEINKCNLIGCIKEANKALKALKAKGPL